MALWAYALRTVAQVKSALALQGNGIDPLIEECVNEASELVEAAWGRHIVSRGSLTEYHPRDPVSLVTEPGCTPCYPTSRPRAAFFVNEWPIVSVTSVHEDAARAYGAATQLVENTDFIVTKPSGKLTRVSGASPRSWLWSWRAIKVVYIGGYKDTAGTVSSAEAVPPRVLRVFDELVAWMIRQRSKGEVGLQSISNEAGSRSFSGPAYVTDIMRAALAEAGAVPATLAGRTGERDV